MQQQTDIFNVLNRMNEIPANGGDYLTDHCTTCKQELTDGGTCRNRECPEYGIFMVKDKWKENYIAEKQVMDELCRPD